MFFVAGLSGSGKTTLIDQLATIHPQLEHVTASTILRSLGRPTIGASKDDLLTNQEFLLGWILSRLRETTSTLILDGHAVLMHDSNPVLVPDDFFTALPLQGLCLLKERPELLLQRRHWPPGLRSTHALTKLQKLEDDALEKIARKNNLPLLRIWSDDHKRMDKLVHLILATESLNAKDR